MASVVRLTKRVVEALVPPEKGSAFLWDADLSGFGVRVWRAARGPRRAYVLKYGTGRRHSSRWLTIGHHLSPYRPDPTTGMGRVLTPDLAREEAIRLLGAKYEGRDPADAREVAATIPTLAEFAPRYLADHAGPKKALRSAAEDRGYLNRWILPKLGGYQLQRIGPGHVTRFHVSLQGKPTTANRCLALLSSMFSLARRWRVLPPGHPNPCEDVERFHEQKRRRFLSTAELARVGVVMAAADAAAAKPTFRKKGDLAPDVVSIAALRVIMFTGARPSEILTLRRDQLDLDQGVVLQQAKSGERPIYLNPPAVEVLRSLPRLTLNPYVFPGHARRRTAEGRPPRRHLTLWGLEGTWERIRELAGCPDVRLYDLRHTFASVAAARGQGLYIIGALLGHVNPETTQRYAHLAADPLRAASGAVAAEIAGALKG